MPGFPVLREVPVLQIPPARPPPEYVRRKKYREKNCRTVDEGGEFRQTEAGDVQEYMVEDK